MKGESLFFDVGIGLLFVVIGVLTRTIWHIGPNIEFVTALSFVAGFFFFRKSFAMFIPLLIMLISDFTIGNTSIFLFTWSGFFAAPLLGWAASSLSKKQVKGFVKKLGLSEIGGIASVAIFFLWTNFGVVFTTTMYQKSLAGLLQSYINGLPFIRNQLMSTVIVLPVAFTVTYFAKRKVKNTKQVRSKQAIQAV